MDGNTHHGSHTAEQRTADGSNTSAGDGRGKGKAKDESFTGRLYESAKLAVNSVAGGQHPVAASADGKATGQASSSNTAPAQKAARETSSYRSQQSTLQGTMKSNSTGSHEVPDAFDSFLDPQPLPFVDVEVHKGRPSSLEKQQMEDGSDVVNLLSMPDEDMDLGLDEDIISPDEAERLRAALFSSHAPSSKWDTLLDFVPSFISMPEESSDRSQYVGTKDPVAARDMWLQQWDDVLSSYTDEVWGDLGPLVVAAKAEVDGLAHDASPGQPDNEARALDRLRLILAHVRGH